MQSLMYTIPISRAEISFRRSLVVRVVRPPLMPDRIPYKVVLSQKPLTAFPLHLEGVAMNDAPGQDTLLKAPPTATEGVGDGLIWELGGLLPEVVMTCEVTVAGHVGYFSKVGVFEGWEKM